MKFYIYNGRSNKIIYLRLDDSEFVEIAKLLASKVEGIDIAREQS